MIHAIKEKILKPRLNPRLRFPYKMLDTSKDPILKTLPFYAFITGSLDLGKANSISFLTNNYIQIAVHKNFRENFNNVLEFNPRVYYSTLEQSNVFDTVYPDWSGFLNEVNNNPSLCIEYVSKMLDDGFYCLSCLDLCYLSPSFSRRKAHIPHRELIVGYDKKKRAFINVGYVKKNGKVSEYCVGNIDFYNFLCSLVSVSNAVISSRSTVEGMRWSMDDPVLFFYKYNPFGVLDVDIDLIINSIQDYLNAKINIKNYRSSGLVLQMREYDSCGIDVYKSIIELIELAISTGKTRMLDMKLFFFIWEHKRVMFMRLKHLEQSGFISRYENIRKMYSKVVLSARKMRFSYLEFHMKYDDSVLRSIQLSLLEMRDLEERILESLLNELS